MDVTKLFKQNDMIEPVMISSILPLQPQERLLERECSDATGENRDSNDGQSRTVELCPIRSEKQLVTNTALVKTMSFS